MNDHSTPPTFGQLWKGWFDNKNPPMNTQLLAPGTPLVNTPKNASADLLRQARQKIVKGQSRRGVLSQLITSTRRGPAAVRGPSVQAPGAAPAAGAPAGFGGGGYSGNVARRLGSASNLGYASATKPAPNPNPTPAPAPTPTPAPTPAATSPSPSPSPSSAAAPSLTQPKPQGFGM